MNDLLKREKVLRTIQKMFDCCTTYDIIDYRDLMTEAIKVLPPERQLDLNRPQGEWERIPYSFVGGYRCSICRQKSLENHHNYCPNCGARMKGADDDC